MFDGEKLWETQNEVCLKFTFMYNVLDAILVHVWFWLNWLCKMDFTSCLNVKLFIVGYVKVSYFSVKITFRVKSFKSLRKNQFD